MKNLKSEKGGVIIYVLVAMLILTLTLIAIYILLTNKQVTQLEIAEQIKETYEKDMDDINAVYSNLVN